MSNDYIIYVLFNTLNNCTYVGITNNPTRRLRQHNGDLVGGAKYTKIKKGEGKWVFYGWIKSNNILIKNRALSLEKKIQINSRKQSGTPIQKRLKAINKALSENDDLIFELNIQSSSLYLLFDNASGPAHNAFRICFCPCKI